MAKLSNKGIYDFAQDKRDKANSPYQTPKSFQGRYEEARLFWMKLKVKDLEVTEIVRSDLWPFLRNKDFGSTKIVRFKDVAPHELLFRTAVHGDFSFSCNGRTNVRTLPIIPRAVDHFNASVADPWNQPDDTEPQYVDRGDDTGPFMEIFSDQTPANVTVEYVIKPKPYALLTDPNGFTEEEELQQHEIIHLAITDMELTIENFNRFQGMSSQRQANGI